MNKEFNEYKNPRLFLIVFSLFMVIFYILIYKKSALLSISYIYHFSTYVLPILSSLSILNIFLISKVA